MGKFLAKSSVVRSPSCREVGLHLVDDLTSADQMGWFKVPLLGVDETAVK